MPLTRHLYREDEVQSALMFSVLRGRHVEAAFWCLELLDSEMVDELLTSMRRIWLCGFGVKALGWLRAFHEAVSQEEIDPDKIIDLVVGLCRIGSNGGRDRSILSLLTTTVEGQPDRVNMTGPVSDKYSPLEAFIVRAIYQRKTLTAWGALLEINEPYKLLSSIAMSKHGIIGCRFLKVIQAQKTEEAGRLEALAAAVAALCLTREEFELSWKQETAPSLLKEVEQELPGWRESLGRRSRRVFCIHPQSLYWMTQRGRTLSVYENNEKEIMGRLEKSAALWGSTFWDRVAEDLGGWQKIRSDPDVREDFYTTYFPDDTPDEWSKACRAKSHGCGPLQRNGKADPVRALQIWFDRIPSSVIWSTMQNISVTDDADTFEKVWSNIRRTSSAEWDFTPVVSRSFFVFGVVDETIDSSRTKSYMANSKSCEG